MNIKDLKVGDVVYIREDLVHLQEYGNAVYYKSKGSGERTIDWFHNDNKDTFVTEEDNCYYTVEMIDWEKTIKIRREKMNIKDLKVGDLVYIREDLEVGKRYGSAYFTEYMKQGVQRIMSIDSAEEDFNIVSKTDSFRYHYTTEMVDWEKTRILKLNESCENIKKVIRVDSIFKEITQSGESGNETTKAVTYDGREITVENNNEENDAEKAVMLLMLKQLGITYGDVKREVEKVKIKWVPQLDEKYYWINKYLEIDWYVWEGHSVDKMLFKRDNCFETRKDAEEKLEKIKEVLRGE